MDTSFLPVEPIFFFDLETDRQKFAQNIDPSEVNPDVWNQYRHNDPNTSDFDMAINTVILTQAATKPISDIAYVIQHVFHSLTEEEMKIPGSIKRLRDFCVVIARCLLDECSGTENGPDYRCSLQDDIQTQHDLCFPFKTAIESPLLLQNSIERIQYMLKKRNAIIDAYSRRKHIKKPKDLRIYFSELDDCFEPIHKPSHTLTTSLYNQCKWDTYRLQQIKWGTKKPSPCEFRDLASLATIIIKVHYYMGKTGPKPQTFGKIFHDGFALLGKLYHLYGQHFNYNDGSILMPPDYVLHQDPTHTDPQKIKQFKQAKTDRICKANSIAWDLIMDYLCYEDYPLDNDKIHQDYRNHLQHESLTAHYQALHHDHT